MDWTDAADPKSAFDWVRSSVTKTHAYNFFKNKRKFMAMALTRATPLSKAESNGNDAAEYIFKARILGDNSPHSFLPDPCLLSQAGNADAAINAIHQHTTFIGYSDPVALGSQYTINPGDLVEVELSKGIFSYNLEKGKFIKVMQAANAAGLDSEACANITLTFGTMEGFTAGTAGAPSIPGVFTSGPLPEGQYRVSSVFQPRRCLGGGCKAHRGTDYAAPTGTKVFAVADGTVFRAVKGCPQNGHLGSKCGGGFGNAVYIEHDAATPQGEKIYSVYAHLSSNVVTAGADGAKPQHVKSGQHIGNVGNSGSSTGPHLHLEIHIGKAGGSNRVDPQQYLTDLPSTETQADVVEESHDEETSYDDPPGVEGEDWEWTDKSTGDYKEL
jgi:murein DD-endopeptidase MepM/ murein hydrolase activator NlpD